MDLVRPTGLPILDDLGAERATGWAREVVLIVISARLAADRQTVVTTNYATAGKLMERFGGGKAVRSPDPRKIATALYTP